MATPADLQGLMQEAKKMQEKMQSMQKELADLVVTGEAGVQNYSVKVKMNGRYNVLGVSIDDRLMEDEKDMLEDLVAAAVNDAVKKIEQTSRGKIGELTKGLKLPDNLKLPDDNK